MTKESDIGRVPYGLAVHGEEEENDNNNYNLIIKTPNYFKYREDMQFESYKKNIS